MLSEQDILQRLKTNYLSITRTDSFTFRTDSLIRFNFMRCGLSWFLVCGLALAIKSQADAFRTHTIPLNITMGLEGKGGVTAADLDGDGAMDLLVTSPGHISAYRTDARLLWHRKDDIRVSSGSSERHGLPGHDAPGVQAVDINGDDATEVLYLDQKNTVHVLNGSSGREEFSMRIPNPLGSERWEHLAGVNLRGKGDQDLVLQATNHKGYRVGHYLAAYAVENQKARLLWKTDHFGALAHGPFRAADLNQDGRDEICGFTILGPDGKKTDWSYPPIDQQYANGASFHIDSLFIYDVRPDIPGLEVVLLEEGRNYSALVSFEQGLLWWTTNRRQEPQNGAVGEFSLEREGLETWCRSRYNTRQKPWVLNAQGEVIFHYAMTDVAPEDWTLSGVEEIVPIHWTGAKVQLAAAKERHESGDVCLFEPMTGRFVVHIKARTDRLYVADITGDWREEIIIVEGNQIRFFENSESNPRPHHPRLWTQSHYRRNKMSWNYYSP
jgi:hypothetical protein